MKITHTLYIILFLLVSCKSQEKKEDTNKLIAIDSSNLKPEAKSFFPVTDYLKGEIVEIKNAGVNPMKFVTIKKSYRFNVVKNGKFS